MEYSGASLDLRRVVEVPVLLWRHERKVRLDEPDREEERLRLLAEFAQRGHREIRHLPVLERVVGHVGPFERRSAGVE
jgi:hypothetical protein